MDRDRPFLAQSAGRESGRKPHGAPECQESSVFHLVDLPEVRTVRIRLAGDPFPPGEAPAEPLLRGALESPERLEVQFAAWVDAGVDALLAPTLWATPARLKPLGLAHCAGEINRLIIETALRSSGRVAQVPWVAAQVGPLGAELGRQGFFGFDEAYIHYHEQAKALALARPDLIIVRGIQDLRVLRAAMVAIRELWSGRVMVLFPARSLPAPESQDPLAVAAEVVTALGAQGIGVEGDLDRRGISRTASRLRQQGLALAGSFLPEEASPVQGIGCLARAGVEVAFLSGRGGLGALLSLGQRGAALTPPPEPHPSPQEPGPLPSRGERTHRGLLVAVEVETLGPAAAALEPGAAGEASSLADGRVPAIAADRIACAAVSIPDSSDALAAAGFKRRGLEERVAAIEARERRPLALVVRDPLVLESALKATTGRAIAYLDSLDTSLWQSVLYLACKYGARLGVRLQPIAARMGERVAPGGGVSIPAILRLFEAAREYGLTPEDLYVDPMGFGEAVAPAWDRETIDAVLRKMPWAKRETGVRWILGCHRFRAAASPAGPPSLTLQCEILSIALFQGLDAVILGPDQTHLVRLIN